MLFVPDNNETIANVIYTALTRKEKNIKLLKEFGYYSYGIIPEHKNSVLVLCFSSQDFNTIYDFSGKEMIEEEYKEFEAVKGYKDSGCEYDIGFLINYEKFNAAFPHIKKSMPEEEKMTLEKEAEKTMKELEKFAREVSEKLSYFRVKFYSSVFDKMLRCVKENQTVSSLTVHLNEKNILHIVPSKDRINLIYGIDFDQTTDQSLTNIVLQEFKEAKRKVINSINCSVYTETDSIPKHIIDIDHPKKYSNGLLVFDLFVKDYERLKLLFNYFVTLREYIQYHVHTIKTFLHIRMNKKGKQWLKKLEGCQIVGSDYLKSLEANRFYESWNKKEDNIKKFNEEVEMLKGQKN